MNINNGKPLADARGSESLPSLGALWAREERLTDGIIAAKREPPAPQDRIETTSLAATS